MPIHPVNSFEEIIRNQNQNLIGLENNFSKNNEIEAKTIPKDNLIISKEDVVDALEKFARSIEIFNKKLKFDIHEESKRIVVKILDAENNKVIREIPSEEMLKLIANLDKMLGIFIDQQK